MTELEKIAYAKSFIDKLANGINPLDDTPIPDGDIANNVRLSRCFFYVSDILRQVYENGGVGKVEKTIPFSITHEQLSQFEFSYELLSLAKQNGLHTCIETCGFAKTEEILKVAEFTDIFLYDWKLTNNKLHKEYTEAQNTLILKNLQQIDAIGSKIILRCPIIPNVNDTEEHFLGIANVANSLENILVIEIEPYHSLGNNKYKKLGKTEEIQSFQQPTKQQVEEWIAQIQKHTEIIVKKA